MPFLALGGMFALVALTGSHEDSPLGAPAPARPTKTSMWWTEPLDAPATQTETVIVEAQRKELRGAMLATPSRVTITETVQATVSPTSSRAPATGRNDTPTSVTVSGPPEPTELEPTNPTVPTSEQPTQPTSATSEPSVPSEPPSSEAPTTTTPTPRSETPTPVPSPEPLPEPEPSLEPSAPVSTSTPVPTVASSDGVVSD